MSVVVTWSNMRAVLLAKEITNAERYKMSFCSNACRGQSVKGVPRPGLLDAYLAKLRATAADRFWQKVAKGEPDQCWEWTGNRNRCGYCYTRWNGRQMLAHRIAIALTDGGWDSPLDVCHTCENTICCNPAHLWRGTAMDNRNDMISKGRLRSLKGSENRAAKLTEDAVLAIRVSEKRTDDLAAEYNVSLTTIRDIKRRDIWRHIP